jgi:hypothetical protein
MPTPLLYLLGTILVWAVHLGPSPAAAQVALDEPSSQSEEVEPSHTSSSESTATDAAGVQPDSAADKSSEGDDPSASMQDSSEPGAPDQN